jgi:hypothetical protein
VAAVARPVAGRPPFDLYLGDDWPAASPVPAGATALHAHRGRLGASCADTCKGWRVFA